MNKIIVAMRIILPLIWAYLLSSVVCLAQSTASNILFDKGIELYSKGKYHEAAKAFKQCSNLDELEMDSLDVRKAYAKQWMAHCYYKAGDIKAANAVGEFDYYWEPGDRRLTADIDSIQVRALQIANNGNILYAIAQMQQSVTMEKAIWGDDSWFVANTEAWIGNYYLSLPDMDSARQAFDEAKRIYQKNQMTMSCAYANLLLMEARLYNIEGNTPLAAQLSSQSLDILRRWAGVASDDNESAYILAYAFMLYDSSQPTPHEACKQYSDTLYTHLIQLDAQKLLNLLDPISLSVQTKWYYLEYTDALTLINKILCEIEATSMLNGSNNAYLWALSSKATTLRYLFRYEEAADILNHLIQLCESTMFFNRNLLDESFLLLSDCYAQSGETYKTIEAANEAYRRASLRNDDRSIIKINAKQVLAGAYSRLSKTVEALEAAKSAVDLSAEAFGTNTAIYAEKLITYARIRIEAGQAPEKAIADLYSCIEVLKQQGVSLLPTVISAYHTLCEGLIQSNQSNEAQSILNDIKALSLQDSLPENIRDQATFVYYQLMANNSLGMGSLQQEYLQKTIDIATKYNGWDCFNEMQQLACAYAFNREFDKAIALCDKLEDMLAHDMNRRNIYAESLMTRACVCALVGNFSDSKAIFSQSLKMLEEIYGKESAAYANAVLTVAYNYNGLGLSAQALSLAKSVEKQVLNLFTPESQQLGRYYSCLAQCALGVENLQQAIEYGEIARSILAKSINKGAYIELLVTLGNSYNTIAQYNKSLSLLNEALTIATDQSMKRHLWLIYTKLGLVYSNMGNFDQADHCFNLCYSMAMDLYQEEDFLLGFAFFWEAYHDAQTGQFDLAQEHMEKAENLFTQRLGVDHPYVSIARSMKAQIDIALGKSNEAILNLETLWQNTQMKDTQIDAVVMAGIALMTAYNNVGEYRKAIDIGEQLLKKTRSSGTDLVATANMYFNIATAYNGLNNVNKFVTYTSKAMEIYKNKLLSNFLSMTKKERMDLWNSASSAFLNVLPLACARSNDHEKITGILYDATLFGKGLLLQTDNNIAEVIATSGDEALAEEYNELLRVSAEHKRLSALYATETDFDKTWNIFDQIDSLYKDIDLREHHLMEHTASIAGDYTKKLAVKWTDVQHALHQGEIAVEFEQAQYSADSLFYYALVLTPHSKVPAYVPLAWQHDISDCLPFPDASESDYHKLYEAFWEPIVAAYPETKKIYFSPIGELYNIPIESLPLPNNSDRLISDQYDVFRLSSTRELITETRTNTAKGMAVYGGLSYKLSSEALKEDALKYDSTDSRGTDYIAFVDGDKRTAQLTLKQLPGTAVEADSILALVEHQFSDEVTVTPYLGNQGTEASFKALSGSNIRILHIGTHGFYFPQTEVKQSVMMQSLLNMYEDATISGFSIDTEEDKALSRCGLYMTGAQNRLDGENIDGANDGILTAKEIASLNFDKLDLAVLSACDTGTGDVTGDGVFGLQRGFKKAGAKTILMSLWSVNDESTSVLMTEFYREWLLTGNMQQSLEKAKRYVREHNDKWRSPYYWAPFVLLDAVE
jgi:CHAT domain-containing protein/tetratricopeptide (TPR) repeat protein